MRRIDGHCDGADRCHGIGQSLLISFGYEPVVSNVRHREFAVIVTGLGVLSEETEEELKTSSPAVAMRRWSHPHHWGVRVGAARLQAVVDHVVVGVGHPGTAAAVGTVRLGTVHQVLFAQGYELTRLLVYLSLDGSCSAEGPTGAAVTLHTRI